MKVSKEVHVQNDICKPGKHSLLLTSVTKQTLVPLKTLYSAEMVPLQKMVLLVVYQALLK